MAAAASWSTGWGQARSAPAALPGRGSVGLAAGIVPCGTNYANSFSGRGSAGLITPGGGSIVFFKKSEYSDETIEDLCKEGGI